MYILAKHDQKNSYQGVFTNAADQKIEVTKSVTKLNEAIHQDYCHSAGLSLYIEHVLRKRWNASQAQGFRSMSYWADKAVENSLWPHSMCSQRPVACDAG